MEEIKTIDMRINKLVSTFMNADGVDRDGDTLIDEDITYESTSTGIALKEDPEACRVVFDAMKEIILEQCDFLSLIVDLEIIEKNDRINGSYSTEKTTVKVVIEDKSNMSIITTMAHELRHAFQHYKGLLNKSFRQKNAHSKVVEDFLYSLEDLDADKEHVREVLYRTSWHEVDARRYARWFTKGGIGKFRETGKFYINEHNISTKLIAQLLMMGELE